MLIGIVGVVPVSIAKLNKLPEDSLSNSFTNGYIIKASAVIFPSGIEGRCAGLSSP